jgi:hypothetical protein
MLSRTGQGASCIGSGPHQGRVTASMRRNQDRRLSLILTGLALLAIGTTVIFAQGDYAMTRSVIAGDGGFSSGGVYDVQGTIGQPVAGATSGGEYGLSSGFWGWVQSFFDVYLPLALSNSP